MRLTRSNRRLAGLMAALAVVLWLTPAAAQEPQAPTPRSTAGQLLVATPELQDPNFVQTVVYVVSHSPEGAMGFVVNRVIGTVRAADLAGVLGIEAARASGDVRLHVGGPVAPRLPFVLHSRDYATDGTIVVDGSIAFTAGTDVEVAMFTVKGAPARRLVVFGHAGWAPGQLDAEIAANVWVVVPAEDAIVFDDDVDTKWQRALALFEVTL